MEPIILRPGEGRAYALGAMRGVFKADGPRPATPTARPNGRSSRAARGPGPHHHDANEEVFLVTEGTMTFLVGDAVDRRAARDVRAHPARRDP